MQSTCLNGCFSRVGSSWCPCRALGQRSKLSLAFPAKLSCSFSGPLRLHWDRSAGDPGHRWSCAHVLSSSRPWRGPSQQEPFADMQLAQWGLSLALTWQRWRLWGAAGRSAQEDKGCEGPRLWGGEASPPGPLRKGGVGGLSPAWGPDQVETPFSQTSLLLVPLGVLLSGEGTLVLLWAPFLAQVQLRQGAFQPRPPGRESLRAVRLFHEPRWLMSIAGGGVVLTTIKPW